MSLHPPAMPRRKQRAAAHLFEVVFILALAALVLGGLIWALTPDRAAAATTRADIAAAHQLARQAAQQRQAELWLVVHPGKAHGWALGDARRLQMWHEPLAPRSDGWRPLAPDLAEGRPLTAAEANGLQVDPAGLTAWRVVPPAVEEAPFVWPWQEPDGDRWSLTWTPGMGLTWTSGVTP